MKRIIFSLAAAATLVAPAFASAKSPLEGRWKSGNMEVVIADCGPHMCGTVVKASANQQRKAARGSGTKLIGARLIEKIEQTGPGEYKARVFVADRDIHASGTIRQPSPNRLDVRGCVLGVICKTKTWTRVR